MLFVICIFCTVSTGAYAGFLKGGGGPTLKFLGFWIYMPRSCMSRAAKLRAFARGGLGACSPKKIFKNGAILCVLRAILTTFVRAGKNHDFFKKVMIFFFFFI